MELTTKDLLKAMPLLMAKETDPKKLPGLRLFASRLEEIESRTLLCDFHGIQVFEYQGKRKLELKADIEQRMRSLQNQTSDSLREMVEDLTALAYMEALPAEEVPQPPEPKYIGSKLLNGEAFHKSAVEIWSKTALHRGFYEYIRTRLANKLRPLCSNSEEQRIMCANKIKREFAEAIDIITKQGGGAFMARPPLSTIKCPMGLVVW